MFARTHFLEDVGEDALFIDDEGGALGDVEEGFSKQGFLAEHAVVSADSSVWIADEREGEGFLLNEFFVALDGIMTDTEEQSFGMYFVPLITNGACLRSSAGCVVFGVKIENYFFTDEVSKLDLGFLVVFTADH